MWKLLVVAGFNVNKPKLLSATPGSSSVIYDLHRRFYKMVNIAIV